MKMMRTEFQGSTSLVVMVTSKEKFFLKKKCGAEPVSPKSGWKCVWKLTSRWPDTRTCGMRMVLSGNLVVW